VVTTESKSDHPIKINQSDGFILPPSQLRSHGNEDGRAGGDGGVKFVPRANPVEATSSPGYEVGLCMNINLC
jgi:hypothetical protein